MGKSSTFITYFQTHPLDSQGKVEENYLLILSCFKCEGGNCHKSLLFAAFLVYTCAHRDAHTQGGKNQPVVLQVLLIILIKIW